jgi:hypothetical protein
VARQRLRRPLKLSPRGSFAFTPKTVSLDVSVVAPGPGARKILHVGRTRGALETFDPDEPPREADLVRVVALLELEDSRRQLAGEPGIETLFERRHLEDIRRLAKSLIRVSAVELPFSGRPRSCFESLGAHPGESLWIARDEVARETGEDAVIETRRAILDETGSPVGMDVTFRRVPLEEASVWLFAESHNLAGDLLEIARAEPDKKPRKASRKRSKKK